MPNTQSTSAVYKELLRYFVFRAEYTDMHMRTTTLRLILCDGKWDLDSFYTHIEYLEFVQIVALLFSSGKNGDKSLGVCQAQLSRRCQSSTSRTVSSRQDGRRDDTADNVKMAECWLSEYIWSRAHCILFVLWDFAYLICNSEFIVMVKDQSTLMIIILITSTIIWISHTIYIAHILAFNSTCQVLFYIFLN
jgi:hypothetical protein